MTEPRQWNSSLPAPTKRLQRKTPLRATILGRPEAPSLVSGRPSYLKSQPHRIPPVVRRDVLERADGLCEACGRWGENFVLHHRKRRSQGGEDAVENLLAVHWACHNRIHQEVGQSLVLNLLLGRSDEPAKKHPALWGEA